MTDQERWRHCPGGVIVIVVIEQFTNIRRRAESEAFDHGYTSKLWSLVVRWRPQFAPSGLAPLSSSDDIYLETSCLHWLADGNASAAEDERLVVGCRGRRRPVVSRGKSGVKYRLYSVKK